MTIYEGYLSFGGNEIVNNARTYGISHSARPCPMHWLKGDVCGTQNAALFEAAPYTYDAIETAPWYDPDMPQSADFYGFFAYSITEAMDSTRIVSRTERVGNGTVNGRTRKSGKTMRVKGLLMGRGRLAIEYGQAWLSAAVDPGACGQHGTECGLTDLQWFADCPPDRGQVDIYTEWAEAGRNLFRNPIPGSTSAWSAASTWSQTLANGYIRYERITLGGVYVGGSANSITNIAAVQEGVAYDLQVQVRPSVDMNMAPQSNWRNASGLVGSTTGAYVLCPANEWTTLRITGTAPAGATHGGIRAACQTTTGNVLGTIVDMRRMRVAQSPADPAYFDGDTAEDSLNRYKWAGVANASESIWESRQPTRRPQTDEEYQATVDGYVRYMHDVSTLSGPIILNTLQAGDFYAYEVEMVFGAERPWVFGKARDIELPPTTPLVIQDIPYNLFPAPSAELAAGTVVTARNLSPNPSVETNATGWTTVADGTAILGANVAGARSTALASVGAASYRALFTAPSAAAAPVGAWFGAQQEVPITDPLERHSINIWAALVPLAGASAPTGIDIQAYWRSAANVTLRTDSLGVIPTAGGFISVSSILPPPGAASVIVRSRGLLASWANGATVQLFTDALAVTVP